MKNLLRSMKLSIPIWVTKTGVWFSGLAVGALMSRIISDHGFALNTAIITAFVVVVVLVWFWLQNKPDQRDMKTVIADGRIAFGLTDDMLKRAMVIDCMPSYLSLETLLNGGKFAASRVMDKQDRINLPIESAVLQIAFLPMDSKGRTVVWKRQGHGHVFNKAHSVLISASPYSSFFGQQFCEAGDDTDKSLLTLRDLYSRKVRSRDKDCSPVAFVPLGILWRPAEKETRPAYCFYLYAARYNFEFNSEEQVLKTFGSKYTAKYGIVRHRYLEKDHDSFRISLDPASDEDKRMLEGVPFEKIDGIVLDRYRGFVNKPSPDKKAHPQGV